ncbi:AAA family ATPase [Paraburkholderia susongensis]|uniref:AAA domain-containing protein n=1 Tax=Paraburkholderia susongensis TaxID=1515439 RepID=A0A1X7KH59_9BURK|nr:AAA family ATPase [Paraburkholderia susongensis]SMG39888.1 AAA domain-containing protein [Paraburkholderia susongensis]
MSDSNVLLDGLAPIMNRVEAYNFLAVAPPPRDSDFWSGSLEQRIEHLDTINGVFVPNDAHFNVFRLMQRAMRAGLKRRDPSSPMVMGLLHETGAAVARNIGHLNDPCLVAPRKSFAAAGLFLNGPTGIGKTTLTNRFRDHLPGAREIKSIGGRPCSVIQIYVVQVKCPSNGTILGLMHACLQEIDRLTGDTKYAEQAIRKNLSRDVCEALLISVLLRHFVGLLIIDDIQYLLKVPHATDVLLGSICSLMETAGVPVLTVGTYAAQRVVDAKSALGAKLLSEADEQLDAIAPGKSWTQLCIAIWAQRVSHWELPMPDWFPLEAHFHTAGIVRVLRILMKRFLGLMAEGRITEVTADALSSCAEKCLRSYRRPLAAARRREVGDKLTDDELAEYEDFLPPDEPYIKPSKERRELQKIADRVAHVRKAEASRLIDEEKKWAESEPRHEGAEAA